MYQEIIISVTLFIFSRKNNFKLLVALNGTGQANGGLFWDDGETIGNSNARNMSSTWHRGTIFAQCPYMKHFIKQLFFPYRYT